MPVANPYTIEAGIRSQANDEGLRPAVSSSGSFFVTITLTALKEYHFEMNLGFIIFKLLKNEYIGCIDAIGIWGL